MAVTWAATAITEGVSVNGKRTKTCVLTPTGTYTTSGDALPLAALGLKRVTRLMQEGTALFLPGISFSLGGTLVAPLILAHVAATGGSGASAQVANGTTITGKAFFAYIEGYE